MLQSSGQSRRREQPVIEALDDGQDWVDTADTDTVSLSSAAAAAAAFSRQTVPVIGTFFR